MARDPSSTFTRAERLEALERGDTEALRVTGEQLQRARALLTDDDPAAAEGLPESVLEAIAYQAVEQKRTTFLARAQGGPKALARAVKKELYRLKSEGRPLEIGRAGPTPPSPPHEADEDVLPAFLSPVDIDGRRGFIAAHVRPDGQLETLVGELSDVEGLIGVEHAAMPRREFKKLSRELVRPPDDSPPWLQVQPAQLGGLLAAVRGATEQRARRLDAFVQLAQLFPGTPQPAASRAWAPRADNDERALLQGAPKLFAQVEMYRWSPPPDALTRLSQRIDEVALSKIVVDEAQRRAQMEAALDRTVEEFFDAGQRATYAERLFQQADYFAGTQRQELADLCAATGRALAGETPLTGIPFARLIFQKALVEQTEAALARLSPEQRQQLLAEERAREQARARGETTAPAPGAASGLILPGR